MFPVTSFPCIYYRTEDYHCVSMSHLFGSPQSRSIFAYEWPRLSVTLTEPDLPFAMLVAMDGNKSLKCVQWAYHEKNAEGKTTLFESREWEDSRTIQSAMYLTADTVNVFKDEVKRWHRPIQVRSISLWNISDIGTSGQ